MLTEVQQKSIKQDIIAIENSLEGNKIEVLNLHQKIYPKYLNLNNWNQSLIGVYENKYLYEVYEHDLPVLVFDLKLMKSKLEGYLLQLPRDSNPEIIVNNQMLNNQQLDVSIETIIDNINNIDSISRENIADIKFEIEQMKNIIEQYPKNQRWDKAKNIIYSLFDRGIDVAIAILPLIYKMK